MNSQSFEYPLFFRLLYRYGNIPVTLLLSVYLVPSVINIDRDLIHILPIIGILTLIYFINRRYLFLYQVVPYRIIADEEKLICDKFFLSSREVIIFYRDIESLSGGVFSGKLKGLMKVYEGKSKIVIGFFDKLKNIDKLQTLILSHVKEDVYNVFAEKSGLRKNK